jgi:hypothetical protein
MIEQSNKLDHMRFRRNKLIEEAETAISWGIPDNESIGYSRAELISIIRKLVFRIKELENE